MGVKVDFIPATKTIKVKSGITAIDFKTDVYSDGKEDWKDDPLLNKFTFPIRAIGGNTVAGGKTIESTYFLRNGWQIEPASEDHELTISGNIYHDDIIPIVKFPSGYSISAILNTTLSPDSGVNAAEIWDEMLSLHTITGTTGKALSDAGGSGNPWSLPVEGNTTAGTFGEMVGSKLLTFAKWIGLK